MKAVKERVREIKSRLARLEDDPVEEKNRRVAALHEELAQLKEAWHRWEGKRNEAARERMILLGHASRHGIE
jgi:hypothetical protein